MAGKTALLIARFGTMVIVGMRPRLVGNRLLTDVSLHQIEELLIERRVLDRFAPHGSQHTRRSGRRGERCWADAHARRLLHLLKLAVLTRGRDEHDAGAVTVVGAGCLQVIAHIQLLARLEVTRASENTVLAGAIQHVALAE